MAKELEKYSHKEILHLIMDELEGVIVTDAEGRYVYVNNRWSSLTGFSLQDVKGKYVRDVVRNSCVDQALSSGKCIAGDAVLIENYTGNEIPMYCSYTPLYQNGELIGCFVYMILKNSHSHLQIPSNVVSLIDELSTYLLEYRKEKNTKYSLSNIIGASPAIVCLKNDIITASRSVSTVLVEGETGTGKELVAHSIHNLSLRAAQPFVKVNCSAIPNELLESEFFGYESGSFTGAQKGGKAGKFETAHKGSLFMDEINQLPKQLQPKFLRVLQEQEIERIGSSKSTPVDTRIIAASNVPLDQMVREGEFCNDLYYRLNVICIKIPPLRERREDIPLIADNLLMRLNYRLQLQIPSISDEAKERLSQYDWPGNVRELQNVIERAMNLAWCESLEWHHFKGYFHTPSPLPYVPDTTPERTATQKNKTGAAEEEAIRNALHIHEGNRSEAARELGISRTSLYKKLRKYCIA